MEGPQPLTRFNNVRLRVMLQRILILATDYSLYSSEILVANEIYDNVKPLRRGRSGRSSLGDGFEK